MEKFYNINRIKFEGDNLALTIDGEKKIFSLKKISPILEKASESERNTFKISPSGYGIHWPLLDEDISIDGLLGIISSSEKKLKVA